MNMMSGGANQTAAAAAAAMAMEKKKSSSHLIRMTLFWSKDTIILFKGWPGTNTGMFVLALILCFLTAFVVEWISYLRLTRPSWSPLNKALTQTALQTVRVALGLLLMLALMSFNGTVILVIILGHTFGFLLFSGIVFGISTTSTSDTIDDDHVAAVPSKKPDLPPYDCCSSS